MKRPFSLLLALVLSVLLVSACAVRKPPNEPSRFDRLATDAIARAVAERGLSAPPDGLKTAVVDRAEVRRYLRQRIKETGADAMMDKAAKVLVDMGGLEPDVDLVAEMETLMLANIGGYYDWITKTLYIADWMPGIMQGPILVHEATHGLQDHHHDLGRFMQPEEGLDDANTAIASLVEGDATLVMFEAMMADSGAPTDAASRDKAYAMMESQVSLQAKMMGGPPILAESMIFPYLGGMNMARAARKRGGWKAIDSLYTDLPLSTEQIIHPEKLLGANPDYPQIVHLPSFAKEASFRTTLGEFGYRFLFRQSEDRAAADRAAAGWDGDIAYLMLPNGPAGETLTVAVSIWDSEADAIEAEAAIRGMKTATEHIARRGVRLIALFGSVDSIPAVTVEGLLDSLTHAEVKSYKALEAKVRSQMPTP
ncbi:MAG: hypothetical protein ACI9MR_004035 [Myxococcota bacterium]|jgi:hypothetical protein